MMMYRSFIYTLLIGLAMQSHAKHVTLNSVSLDAATGKSVVTPVETDPTKTAIIVIDMWNSHWCMTTAERVSAMVPRMNDVLEVARRAGMQVIWDPTDVVNAYSGYPQYERAIAVERKSAPDIRGEHTCKFTAVTGDCQCGPGFPCGVNYGWDAMHPDLKIDDRDLISSSTDEIYALLAERGITSVIYMGVATNMCVYGKPGAIRHLWKAGLNCMLALDLNDAFSRYDPATGYTPDTGTAESVANLQAAGIPGVNLGEDFRNAGLWKPDRPVDCVLFTPWGKPDRPYLMEQTALVTLSTPRLEGVEIRYTTDGSEPTARSPLYTAPLKIAQTTTVRATAFRKGKPASLPGSAHYVKMPDVLPATPDIYLDDLEYTVNEYLKSVPTCLWYPQKGKSYEGKPLHVRKTHFTHGMGFRAPSSVQYVLKPEYRRFVALAGIDENMLQNNNGRFLAQHSSVVFKVFIDGVLAAESPVMRISQEPWRFDVEIPSGSRRINLVCADAGSRNILDYGNWVDAGFVTK
ncbi:MAG: NPCBM/NEW2 domain-containing protein [Tannerella sp.]|jgi:nicotinamidase-related amidase|nr:NPCBM/NEW2 domain-containing protein [Tannerella sp.]